MVKKNDAAIERHVRELYLTGNAYVKHGRLEEAINVYSTAIHYIDYYKNFVDLKTARDIRRSRLACYNTLNMTDRAADDFHYLINNPAAPEDLSLTADLKFFKLYSSDSDPLRLRNLSPATIEASLRCLHRVGNAYADRGELEVAVKLYTLIIGAYSYLDSIDPSIIWNVRVSRYKCYLALNWRDEVGQEVEYFVENNQPPRRRPSRRITV
ncbi:hypothetical protein LshimejAT787_1001300 [Lyophyllum shimeji]|uniref:Tetratricopeptide repeat protein n=1 Tax=Lyophyllum shimeji TaxID=47721 RepID=A0A9P3URN3_LYOSH|nr:hypothetical protein LshimejAT787_1001300 [Lyophyllum shimeji]